MERERQRERGRERERCTDELKIYQHLHLQLEKNFTIIFLLESSLTHQGILSNTSFRLGRVLLSIPAAAKDAWTPA